MKGISIIICCYNSALRLHETLNHIVLQKVAAGIPFELIIVNNASTDNTDEVASSAQNRFLNDGIDFKIVKEATPGLSHARNKGVQSSQYDYIIFCDDDNWLSADYVEKAFTLMEKWPNAGVIGGVGLANPETEPPTWFNGFKSYYATGRQYPTEGLITGKSPYVYGAGAVVRKACLKQLDAINFSPLATDRTSNKLSSGGDVELCYAIKLLGHEIFYSETLRFRHFIPAQRLKESYILDLVYQLGYCNSIHRPYHWLFNSSLPFYKKSFLWTLLISLHLYGLSYVKLLCGRKADTFANKVNYRHASGRLAGTFRLNLKMGHSFVHLKNLFSIN